MTNKLTKIRAQQGGFVSLAIALTIIVVLALITVGFAQISRREQNEALNKQLNAQANYAAESGVNDAYDLIKRNIISKDTLSSVNDGTTCVKLGSIAGSPFANSVNSGNGVSYSCAVINVQPTQLKYTNVAPDSNKHTTFATSAPITDLDIHWDSATRTSFPGVATGFETFAQWTTHNYPAVIIFKITPMGASFDQTDLANNTFTAVLYPSTGGTVSAPYKGGALAGINAQGPIISGNCSAASGCNAKITGVSAGVKYLVAFHTIYATADNIVVTPTNNGTNLKVIGGQAQIDVTGKARNVLKRIQVRKMLDNSAVVSNFAIEAQNICKRIKTEPSSTSFDSSGLGPGAGPACDLTATP